MDSTEEGKKVTRNQGDKFIKVFRKRTPEISMAEFFGVDPEDLPLFKNKNDSKKVMNNSEGIMNDLAMSDDSD